MADHADPVELRLALFSWLTEQVALYGEVLPRELFLQGFMYREQKIPSINPGGRGIWKPKSLDAPLSLFSSARSAYNDSFQEDALLYHYEGTDPNFTSTPWSRMPICPYGGYSS